ncbi:MAG: PAS domain S-box protein [Bacteroidetes bacterium]|nr:PAS domain S-box protein [Bacteroidota bacterium]
MNNQAKSNEELLSELTELQQELKSLKETCNNEYTQLLLKSIIESPKDIIILSIDKDYQYLIFNSYHRDVMLQAYGKEIKVGMNLLECITNDDDRVKSKLNYDRALNGESHLTIEEYGDLERSCYETRYNPVVNDKNEIIGATAFSANITLRIQAEEAVLAKQILFRRTFNTSPLSSVLTKLPERTVVDVNPAFEKLFGYTNAEIIGNPINELDMWADPAERERVAQILFETGKVHDHEFVFKTKTGETGHGIFYAEIIEELDEKYMLTKVLDITQLKKAEVAIRIHTGRLQNLHEIDQAILLAIESPEAVVQTALQQMRNLLQCQRTSVGIFDLENKKVQVFAADVDGKTIIKTGTVLTEEVYGLIDILRQSKMEVVENMSVLKSPSAINKILEEEGIESFINVALVSEMEMYGVLNVGWENPRTFTQEEIEIVNEVASQITIAIEKARLLKETRHYADELETRVSERTSQLEETNKELEAFSYSVSHDLRAPLRHINGYVDLLNDRFHDSLSEKGKHYLDTIADSTRQMGTLIDDLLQFSRTGKQEMHLSNLDMNLLFREVLDKIKQDIKGRKIKWIIAPLPQVRGDYNLLQLVWVNLLNNAVKFTRNRENTTIEIGFREKSNEYEFYIRDNGAGFDMRYAHKLFGVFQRLHSAGEFEGTGIGLANVHRIILKHGGRTWAEAELEKGATFYFTLPRQEDAGMQ